MKFVPSWFPGAGFQKDIKAVKETNNITRDNPINFVKERMVPSFNYSIVQLLKVLVVRRLVQHHRL